MGWAAIHEGRELMMHGYTCSACGQWVISNTIHQCPSYPSYQPAYWAGMVAYLPRMMRERLIQELALRYGIVTVDNPNFKQCVADIVAYVDEIERQMLIPAKQ